jgi:hypothetical protein
MAGRFCRRCKSEIPYMEAWSYHCKKCRGEINRLSAVKKLDKFGVEHETKEEKT